MLLGLLGVLVGQVGQGNVLEGTHGGEHRATDPSSISSVKVSIHADVSVLRMLFSDGSNFIVKSLSEALHHGGSSSQNNVVV